MRYSPWLAWLLAFWLGSVSAEPLSPKALLERLDHAELDFARAVDATGIEISREFVHLVLGSGVLVPAKAPDDPVPREWVFVGRGRLLVRPGDPNEARQLELFHGSREYDRPLTRALILPGDGDLFRGLPSIDVEKAARNDAETLWRQWVDDAEREGFGARTALVRSLAGDPRALRFFGLWFDSPGQDRGFLAIDPSVEEPFAFGTFEAYRYEQLLTRKRQRRLKRADRHLTGGTKAWPEEEEPSDEPRCAPDGTARDWEYDEAFDPEDAVPWREVWSRARVSDGPAPPRGLEPEHYALTLEIDHDYSVKGSATIRLRPVADGLRLVDFGLHPDLLVCGVKDRDGTELPFRRDGFGLTVGLAAPTSSSAEVELTIDYAGTPIRHLMGRTELESTVYWYPHTGLTDLATYDVRLSWPRGVALLANGEVIEAGEDETRAWTHRRIDTRTAAATFEIGDFDVVEDRVGHIDLHFGFHRDDPEMTPEIRAEIVRTTKAALLFYETHLGRLAIDDFSIVTTATRPFSQGLIGFMALAEGAIHRPLISGAGVQSSQEGRLATVAHEVAHQWWGHMVGWHTYRDQWLSEALADFSAIRFMDAISRDRSGYSRKLAAIWRKRIASETPAGQPIMGLGPVTLGNRLSVHGAAARVRIMYDKGAAVFATLTTRLGEDHSFKLLGELTRAVKYRTITTSTFFQALEKMSGESLEEFSSVYVNGTTVPHLYWRHEVEPEESGGWIVRGSVRQLPSPEFRFAVVRHGDGWDVIRQSTRDPSTDFPTNYIPFYVELPGPDGTPIAQEGMITATGESSTFEVRFDEKPTTFLLDPHGKMLVFLHEVRDDGEPHRLELGEHLRALGRIDEATTILEDLIETTSSSENASRAHLILARAALDAGDGSKARAHLKKADSRLPRDSTSYLGERTVLRGRLDMWAPAAEAALTGIRRYLKEHSLDFSLAFEEGEHLSRVKVARGELLALLTASAFEVDDPDLHVLLQRCKALGIDVRALRAAR